MAGPANLPPTWQRGMHFAFQNRVLLNETTPLTKFQLTLSLTAIFCHLAMFGHLLNSSITDMIKAFALGSYL